jgi:hypothetical protein
MSKFVHYVSYYSKCYRTANSKIYSGLFLEILKIDVSVTIRITSHSKMGVEPNPSASKKDDV